MSTELELQAALRDIAKEHWATYSHPVLLSNLPPLIEEKIQDYKKLLRGSSLKAYIKESSAANGVKLVEHPTQKAKVGIVPADIDFQFEPIPTDASAARKPKFDPSILLAFLNELSKLPDTEIEKVNIPVSVLSQINQVMKMLIALISSNSDICESL